MIEREDILDELQTRLKGVAGVAIVTRNWRKVATVDEFPAIFIMEGPDDVRSDRGKQPPVYMRYWAIHLVTIYQGSTEEQAPKELAAFQKLVRKAIYEDQKTDIGSYGANLREIATSRVSFPAIGNKSVAQELIFGVNYIENTARLFN